MIQKQIRVKAVRHNINTVTSFNTFEIGRPKLTFLYS